MRRIMFFLFLSLSLATTGHALTVFDPSNYAQNLLTATRSLEAIQQRAQQLLNDAEKILLLQKNIQNLDISLLEPLQESLGEIRGLLEQAEGIALNVEDMRRTNRELFPREYKDALQDDDILKTAEKRWKQRIETFEATMGLGAKVLENIKVDRQLLGEAMVASKRAIGTKAAQQAGNEMLALIVKQQMQLQQMLALLSRSTVLDQREKAAKEEESRRFFDQFIGTRK